MHDGFPPTPEVGDDDDDGLGRRRAEGNGQQCPKSLSVRTSARADGETAKSGFPLFPAHFPTHPFSRPHSPALTIRAKKATHYTTGHT